MKKLLNCAVLAALLIGVGGCGNDDTVNPPVNTNATVEFKQNDKFRYAYYEHDTAASSFDARIESSRQIKEWTVLQTGLSVGGRSSVSKIEEVTYTDQAGTVVGSRDTLYLQGTASGNGEVLQYNVLNAVIRRFLAVVNYADSLPSHWAKISDTKTTGAMTWNSLFSNSLDTKLSIDIPGFGTVNPDVTITMRGSHKGTQAVTVAAGPYPSSVHTDHAIAVAASVQVAPGQPSQEVVRDTLTLSYDVDVKGGILRQVLHSGNFTPQGVLTLAGVKPAKIPGFELELLSVTRVQ